MAGGPAVPFAPIMWIQAGQLVACRPLEALSCTLAFVAGVSLSACALDDRQPEVVAPKTGEAQSGSNQRSNGTPDAGASCESSSCVAVGAERPSESVKLGSQSGPAAMTGAGGAAGSNGIDVPGVSSGGASAGGAAATASGARPPAPRCVPANGVSGAPRSIQEVMILMNTLPRPTTLDCFLQSLDRPIDVVATNSTASLQPAIDGADNPRMFIVRGPLEMSIVPTGTASAVLLLGFRTTPSRSIKTEILFPLQADITDSNLFERVLRGSSTKCGDCHADESQTSEPDFFGTVFESDVIEPLPFQDVAVDTLRMESQSCDPQVQPERCAMLSALFDYGDVRQTQLGLEAARP